MLLEDMLTEMGHTIACTATDLDEAIALATSEDYDLAIIDINLKGQRTFPVASIVRERKLPLIFSTGYGEGAIDPNFSTVPLLQKPFNEKGLAEALAKFG